MLDIRNFPPVLGLHLRTSLKRMKGSLVYETNYEIIKHSKHGSSVLTLPSSLLWTDIIYMNIHMKKLWINLNTFKMAPVAILDKKSAARNGWISDPTSPAWSKKKNVLITDVLCLVVNCVWYMANLHVNWLLQSRCDFRYRLYFWMFSENWLTVMDSPHSL